MSSRPIQAAILSVEGLCLNDNEKSLLEKSNPLGVTLFGRNIADKEQVRSLVKEIREVIGRNDVLIATDQEGGRVRRLREPEYIAYASQNTLGRLAEEKGLAAARRAVICHSLLTANDLKENLINFNYAPVLDLAYPDTNPVLKSRSFGSDKQLAAELGNLMLEEYAINGICPCIKHLPGHGRAKADPHLELPVIDCSLKELENDFYPFQKLNFAPAGMTAHLLITAVDDQKPITQSKKGIDTVIRGIIGFDGLLLSDAIDMHALKGTIGERTALSIAAGCDVVCYCLGNYQELLQVTENCGFMTDKAMERFQTVRDIIGSSALEKAATEYQKLIGEIETYDDTYDATETLNKMKHKGEK